MSGGLLAVSCYLRLDPLTLPLRLDPTLPHPWDERIRDQRKRDDHNSHNDDYQYG
jgi:hypothetical protein